MFCRKCGKQLQDEAFCPVCGTPAEGGSLPDRRMAGPAEGDTEAKGTRKTKKEKKKKPEKPQKKRRWIPILCVLAVLFLTVDAGLFYCLRQMDQNRQIENSGISDEAADSSVFVEEKTTEQEGMEMTTSFERLPLSYWRATAMKVRLTNISAGRIEKFTGTWECNDHVKVKGDPNVEIAQLGPGETTEFTVDLIQRIPISVIVILGVLVLLLMLMIFVISMARRHKRKRAATAVMLAISIACSSVNLSAFAAESVSVDGESRNAVYELKEKKDGAFSRTIESHRAQLRVTLAAAFTYDHVLAVRVEAEGEEFRLSWSPVEDAKGYKVILYDKEGNGRTIEELDKDETEAVITLTPGELSVCQVAGELKGDKLFLSEKMNLAVTEDGKTFIDSDGDMLSDEYEAAFGTATHLQDTDGDGLSDMDEISLTMTDPLKADTDGNGIPDGEEDPDGDGLTNLEEIRYGTLPHQADTDLDGLTDGFEINEFRSDPLTADTDEDGLTDEAEYRLGTDPLKADTNDNGIGDAKEIYTHQITSDQAGTVVTLEAAGDVIADARIINQTANVSFADLEYVASEVVDVVVEGEFTSAFVAIPYEESFIGKEEDLAVCYYNPDTNSFEILEGQTVDKEKGVISAVTTHFSTFVLVYVPNWHAQFEDPFAPDRAAQTPVDVELVIDESSSMEDNSKGTTNDPDRWRVTAAKSFVDALIEHDRVGVIGFSESVSQKSPLTDDLLAARSSIDSIVGNAGGTAMYVGLEAALAELEEAAAQEKAMYPEAEERLRLPFIIALSDGEDSASDESRYTAIVDRARALKAPIFTIALGSDVNSGRMIWLASQTQGDYFQISSADDLPQAFNRIVNNAVYGEDTDGDGLADKVEEYGLRDGLGRKYLTDARNPDTDDDEISDGKEAGDVFLANTGNLNLQYYIMLSDPTKADTDGDGLDDKQEMELGTKPWCRDTDGDGLDDNLEYLAGFDPLSANPDGDSYSDYEEYYDLAYTLDFLRMFLDAPEGTFDKIVFRLLDMALDRDPFDYDNTPAENLSAVLLGILLGDFGETFAGWDMLPDHYVDCFAYIIGNIAGNFVPFVSVITDVRDMIANLINGDYAFAAMNAIGAIPVLGNASSAAADLMRILASHMDDAAKLSKILVFVADCFQTVSTTLMKMDDGVKAFKKMVANGIKKTAHRAAQPMVDLFGRFVKTAGDSGGAAYADDLLDAGMSQKIKLTVSDGTTGREAANQIRSSLGNVPGGKLTETASGTAYQKVRVLDLQCESYKNAVNIESTLKSSLRDVADFSGNGKIAGTFDYRILDVAVPDTVITDEARQVMVRLKQEAADMGVTLNYHTYILEGSGEAVTVVAKSGDDVAEQVVSKSALSEADRLRLDKWEYRPSDDLYLKYKDVYDNPKYFDQATGHTIWPPDDGFAAGTKAEKKLNKDTIFKRYGEETGEFLGNATDSFAARALAPYSESSRQHYYRLTDEFEMTSGKVAPWFGSSGGGEQFVKYRPDGSKYTVKDLIDEGILEDITDEVEKGLINID